MNLKYLRNPYLLIIATLILQGCNISKYLDEGEVLYTGAKVELEGPKTHIKKKALASKVKGKMYPKPNKKFLGMTYTKVWLHEKVKPKKEKGFKHWLKNKLGEPPVLITDVDQETMEKVAQKVMQDNGYFNSRVTSEEVPHKKKEKFASIHYTIFHGEAMKIDSVIFPNTVTELDSLISNYKNFRIKRKKIYTLEDFTEDRIDLAEHIRSFGYYDFDESDIFYMIDSTRADNEIDIYLKVRSPRNDSLHRKYYIREVHVYPTYESQGFDTVSFAKNFNYKGIYIHQDYEYIGKKSIYRNTLIEPGKLFSVRDYDFTSGRFINLDIFKYVNINYKKSYPDSLDVEIMLTPTKYQSFHADVEANTSNRSFLGTEVAFTYNNKNLMRGAENLTIRVGSGTEFQVVEGGAGLGVFNINFEARLDFPGLITFFKTRKQNSEIVPKTFIRFQEEYQRWLKFFTLNNFNTAFGYDWQTKNKFNHHLEPAFLSFLLLSNTTEEFDSILGENPLLKTSFNTSLIMGSNYNFNFSNKDRDDQKSYIYYSASSEVSGNLVYLLAKPFNKDNGTPYKIFNVPFAQYFKVDNEIRHYWDITEKMTIASRLMAGVGFAYGNSEIMPYIKQYFMGGPNSLRGFPFRSVGPGNFAPEADNNNVSRSIEQSGDIRLLANLEYRFTIYKFIKSALFFDAGNVWLRKNDPDRPGGKFSGSFIKDIALNTGVGIRLDFNIFAIRVDLGIPLYKPNALAGQKWITEFPEDNFKDWRKENWVWNIAIGYPF